MTAGPAPRQVYRRLLRAYGPQGWWPVRPAGAKRPAYRPGFKGRLNARQQGEVAVGAILTQNTAWTNVEKALGGLHAGGLRDLQALAKTRAARLERLIRPSGYFRQKARKLGVFARHAQSRGGLAAWLSGPLTAVREELLSLWGIGPETADSILLYAARRPSFVVDAYTLRIGERLGWWRGASYASAQAFLTRRLPRDPELYGEFHALFVRLAKEQCRKIPACAPCPLRAVCRRGRKERP